MSEPLQDEDRTILAVLEALETAADADSPAGAAAPGDEGETLARLYTEVLGLLPLALAPVVPPPALKQRILALTGDETQELDGSPAAEEAPSAASPGRVAAPVYAMPAAAAATLEPARRQRASRWPLALAASLALALLGVSAWSAWLYGGMRLQGATIDNLTRELQGVQARAESLAEQQAAAEAQLAELKANFGLVTSPAVEMNAMRPAEQSPQPQARGVLYVAADHQHWYLSVHGLEPLGNGRQYQLWFMTDTEAVSGGTFDARPGSPVNLSSEHMPAGTKAVVITMEPGSGAPAPSGPEVLRATGKVQVL